MSKLGNELVKRCFERISDSPGGIHAFTLVNAYLPLTPNGAAVARTTGTLARTSYVKSGGLETCDGASRVPRSDSERSTSGPTTLKVPYTLAQVNENTPKERQENTIGVCSVPRMHE